LFSSFPLHFPSFQQADQRLLEAELWTAHGIRTEFFTLNEINKYGTLDSNGQLFLQNRSNPPEMFPVSIAYFRAGYTPNDYPTKEEWAARELVENSNAIKCPSVGYHLAGAKAIQAALCKKGVLEQFLDQEECQQLRYCFMEQYFLGDTDIKEEVQEAIRDAIENGKNWVLKPQREGE
jgi:hypothetical protein